MNVRLRASDDSSTAQEMGDGQNGGDIRRFTDIPGHLREVGNVSNRLVYR